MLLSRPLQLVEAPDLPLLSISPKSSPAFSQHQECRVCGAADSGGFEWLWLWSYELEIASCDLTPSK